MSNKHKQRSLVPQHAADKPQQKKYINHDPQIMRGWSAVGDNANVFLSIRFVQSEHQCFCDWAKQDMEPFWGFVEILHRHTWEQVYRSAGRGENKTGVGYTLIPADQYPSPAFRAKLDPEINFFELRVDQQRRVHGFRDGSIFYLCWLDRNHEITGS